MIINLRALRCFRHVDVVKAEYVNPYTIPNKNLLGSAYCSKHDYTTMAGINDDYFIIILLSGSQQKTTTMT